MPTYGVTATGFIKKPLTVIKADLEAAVLAAFGASFDVATESPMGQLIGIMADRIAEAWDAMESVYASFTAEGAYLVSLDNVSALTGTKRRAATRSTVTARLTGTPAASIAAATFSVNGTGAQFKMDANATIGGGGTVDVPCTAVLTGATIATAGTLTVIDTPRAGLSSVTNVLDASVGSNLESDSELRVRREAELRASGKAALEPVREAVLAVKDTDGTPLVTGCIVFENVTDVTDEDGLPPHSINVLATCDNTVDVDSAVAAAIFASKAAGIQTFGSDSAVVTDSQGISRSIYFDRPTERDIYVRLDLVVDASTWPADGAAQVKAALVAYGLANLVTGKDVVSSALAAQAFRVSGVLDTGLAKIGLAPSPASTTTIAVSIRQQAKLDTSRIDVFTTPGTP